jgi:hypothetical protein
MKALLRRFSSIVLGLLLCRAAQAEEPFTHAQLDQARAIRDRALSDDVAYDLLRSLTTEVGPRSAGSPGMRER